MKNTTVNLPSMETDGIRDGESAPAPPRTVGSWPLLAVAFGLLLAIILISGLATLHRATELYSTVSALNRKYRLDWRSLDEIRSGIHVSSVLVRDYLLDPSFTRAKEIREELLRLRKKTEEHLEGIEKSVEVEGRSKVFDLRAETNAYWESLDPVFDWSPIEKQAAAYGFLRRQIMTRRDAVLTLAGDVQHLMDTTFQRERHEIRANEQSFRVFLIRTIGATLGLGLLVAFLSVVRVTVLERRSEQQRLRTEGAEHELRRLSHQLVHTQEEERRSISRELHDEVGQMLTGLRMELRTLQKVHRSAPEQFDARVDQTRILLEQTLQSVRDIAMGLRPSMLDDLGLEAAVQWQIRQFERRHEIAVSLNISTNLKKLSERQITSLYRIVQEALTNCARHSKATSVEITLSDSPKGVQLAIRDNGVGVPNNSGMGLGLLGIQERARELGGFFRVQSESGKGTRLFVDLPREEVLVHA